MYIILCYEICLKFVYINNRLFDGLSSSFIVAVMNSLIGFWTQVGCHFRTQLWGGSIEWQQVWLFHQRWSYETLLVSVFLIKNTSNLLIVPLNHWQVCWIYFWITESPCIMLNLFFNSEPLHTLHKLVAKSFSISYCASYMYSKYSSDYNPLLPN